MLAEIFFLRLETMARVSDDTRPIANARFVPFSRDATLRLIEGRDREARKA
jgi:hypothetical protein